MSIENGVVRNIFTSSFRSDIETIDPATYISLLRSWVVLFGLGGYKHSAPTELWHIDILNHRLRSVLLHR